jgi:hypothetical protein
MRASVPKMELFIVSIFASVRAVVSCVYGIISGYLATHHREP